MPSTVIADLRYDARRRILSVWFRPSGRRYDYFDVPEWEYDALRHAPSKGRYFNTHVRDSYAFEAVDAGPAGSATVIPFLRP